MLDDLAYWWSAGPWSRLGVAACIAILLLILPWLAYEHSQEGPRWERYKAAHHCYLRYRPGELGHTDSPSGHEAWDCQDPHRLIFKSPYRDNVGGQI